MQLPVSNWHAAIFNRRISDTSLKVNFFANWHTVISLDLLTERPNHNLIAFNTIYLLPTSNSCLGHFSLVFKIIPKAGVRPILFQHKFQLLISHFFRAKCVTSYETFLLEKYRTNGPTRIFTSILSRLTKCAIYKKLDALVIFCLFSIPSVQQRSFKKGLRVCF